MFNLEIVEAEREAQTRQVVALLREYFLWLRRRYVAEMPILDTTGFHEALEHELADLKGRYGAPNGAILLALVDDTAAGCIMFRPLSAGICEMRRLFVHPAFKGQGVGSALVSKLAGLAIARGNDVMRLEVGPRQQEAIALFRDVGFHQVEPYCDPRYVFKDQMLFMEADARTVERESTRRGLRHQMSALASTTIEMPCAGAV